MAFTPRYKARFVVNLNVAPGRVATVDYATVEGTAKPGVDYTAATGTLSFDPTQTQKVIEIPIRDVDVGEEGTFGVRLSNPVNCATTPTLGLARITGAPQVILPALVFDVLGSNFGGTTLAGVSAHGSRVLANAAGVRTFFRLSRALAANERIRLHIRRPTFTGATPDELVDLIPVLDSQRDFYYDDTAYTAAGPSAGRTTVGLLSYAIEALRNNVSQGVSSVYEYSIAPANAPVVADLLAWYGSGNRTTGWKRLAPTGTEQNSWPGGRYIGRITTTPQTGVITWRYEWLPVGQSSNTPALSFPIGANPVAVAAAGANDYSPEIAWPAGMEFSALSLYGISVGELRFHAAVDGVEIAGYLWMVFTTTTQPYGYSDIAWGYSAE